MFSKPEEGLRAMSERTIPGLMNAIGIVLRTVTAKDIFGWFRSCGYHYKQERTALSRWRTRNRRADDLFEMVLN